MAKKIFLTPIIEKIENQQKYNITKQFLGRNVHFSNFYDLLFRTSYRQKKAKNVIFGKYLFFRGSISRKQGVLRKI